MLHPSEKEIMEDLAEEEKALIRDLPPDDHHHPQNVTQQQNPTAHLNQEKKSNAMMESHLQALEEEDEEELQGRNFSMCRPWVGNIQPPSKWEPNTLKMSAPDVLLDLDYVYGYRSRQARQNLHWIDEPNTILYHAAAVCVICDVATRTQRHYREHTDDILCLDYCRDKRVAASGGLGKRNTAPIMIWTVDDLRTIQIIRGTLQFAVIAVSLSPDASRVFGIGMDTFHSVAIFDTVSGTCLATANGDSNRLIHGICNTTQNPTKNFVTIGISSIKFWQKTKTEFTCHKAIGGKGVHAIASQTLVSVCCTAQYVCVGNVSGGIYIFKGDKLQHTLLGHAAFVGALYAVGHRLYSGGRDGLIKQWFIQDAMNPGEPEQIYDVSELSYLSSKGRYVKNEAKRPKNGARSLCVQNGNVLVGTQLASIYILPNPAESITVLEGHFEYVPGSMPELWGLDIHPKEPLFCSVADDATLRLWSLDLGSMILMVSVTFPARCCSFSHDGSMIAVGHQNGAFSVWDAMTLTPILPYTRKRAHRIQACSFSPNGLYLALAMGQANLIDVYYVKKNFQWIGVCDATSANIKKIDWNVDGTILQCCTSGYEILHYNVPECEINQSAEISDEKWKTHSCFIGWGVQGIWEGCNDGTDVNSAARSNCCQYLAAGYDSSRIRLYNWPCLPKVNEMTMKETFPVARYYQGHSSHVTGIHFSPDDRYVISCGGMDLTILRWRVVPAVKGKDDYEGDAGSGSPKKTQQDILRDVEEGKIKELGDAAKKKFVLEPELDTTADGKDGKENQDGTSKEKRPASPPRKSTLRRPFSAKAGAPADVESRLFNTTASMAHKTYHGRAQREHVLKQESAKRRFNRF